MAVTLAQLISSLRAHSFNLVANQANFPDSLVVTKLNEATAEIINRISAYNREYLLKSTTLSTVAGQAYVVLPDDFLALVRLCRDRNTGSQYDLRPAANFAALDNNTTSSGSSVYYYYVAGGKLYLSPIPDSTVAAALSLDYSGGYSEMGVVNAVTVASASGYVTAPAVTLLGGEGNGAAATASVTLAGGLTVAVDTGGAGYSSAPTVAFANGNAVATASIVTAFPLVSAWKPLVIQSTMLKLFSFYGHERKAEAENFNVAVMLQLETLCNTTSGPAGATYPINI